MTFADPNQQQVLPATGVDQAIAQANQPHAPIQLQNPQLPSSDPQLQSLITLNNVHSWMPLQTQAALAQNFDPQSAMQIADQMRQVAQQNSNSVAHIMDDPVLQAQPSKMMMMRQYVNHVTGPIPVAESDLSHVQQQLQAQGVAKDLPVDGVWSPAWSSAMIQAYQTEANAVLAGEHRPASATAGHASSWMKALLPTQAFDAIWGYAKSMPNQMRQLGADIAGGLASTPQDIEGELQQTIGLGNSGIEAAHRTQDVTAGFVEGKTPEQYRQEINANPVGRGVQDMANLFTIATLGGGLVARAGIGAAVGSAGAEAGAEAAGGAAAAEAGGEAAAPQLSMLGKARALTDFTTPVDEVGLNEATIRGPQVVARSLGRLAGTTAGRGIAGAGIGTAIGAYRGDTGAQLLRDAAIGGGAGVAGSYVYNNIPILQQVGGQVAELAGKDGLYYRLRTMAALPYEYAPVRAAGTILGKAGIAGAGLRTAAALSPGDATDFTKSVQGEHTFDTLNDAVKHKLDFTVLGQDIKPSLDWLAFGLHPALHGPDTLSLAMSNKATDAHQALNEALGETNVISQLERATDMKWKDIVDQAGGADNARFWATNKARDMASAFYSEQKLNDFQKTLDQPLSLDDKVAFLQRAKYEANADPNIWQGSLKQMLAQGNAMKNMVQSEITHSGMSPQEWASHGVNDYAQAVQTAREHFIPNQDFLGGNPSGDLLPHEALGPNGPIETAENAASKLAGNPTDPPPPMLSVMRNDYLDANTARHDVAQLTQRLQDASQPGARAGDLLDVQHDINLYLQKEFGVVADDVPDQSYEGKLALLSQKAERQASLAVIDQDAPQAMKDAAQRLNELGYKLAWGRDTGWALENQPNLDLGQTTSLTRKLIGNIGMNVERFNDTDVATDRRNRILQRVQSLIDMGEKNGGIDVPMGWTAEQLVSEARNTPLTTNPVQRAMVALGMRDQRVQPLADAIQAAESVDATTATALAKQRLEQEALGVFQLRDIPRGKFVSHFTSTPLSERAPAAWQHIQWAAAHGDEDAQQMLDNMGGSLLSQTSAERLYRGIVRGSADTPTYMLGASRLEDLGRASMGMLGDVIPGNAGEAVANFPNELARLRNQLRFQLSPMFSIRRLLKTNMKLQLEGVDPTFFPLHDMMQAGTADEDLGYLNKLFPQFRNDAYDDGSRYLVSNDVFGIYDHRNMEARAAGIMKRDLNMSDSDIKTALMRQTGYGSYQGEQGRTALERSANFLFFPFSFDKTVYRNIGAYMLDHPGQTMMLNGALSTWNAYDKDHRVWDRLKAQVPILEEGQRLNMFAHGVSAGEPGGINAPFLNMFLPQSWSTDKRSQSTLERFIPALKDAQRTMKEVSEEGPIIYTGGRNLTKELSGHITASDPIQATGVPNAQLPQAYAYKRKLYDDFADVLRANTNNDNKLSLPNDPKLGQFAGQPVTKQLLRNIVQAKYPAYNPAAGAKSVDQLNQDLSEYRLSVQNSSLAPYIMQFLDTAPKVASALDAEKYTPEQAAAYTDVIRRYAVWLSARDPEFYKAYDKYFRYHFGPIESQTYDVPSK